MSASFADSPLVLSFEAELVAGEEPLGALSGAAGLDVGGLLAGLPAAGHDDGALYGRALLAVDVLGVAETQRLKVLASEVDVALLTRRARQSRRGCRGCR